MSATVMANMLSNIRIYVVPETLGCCSLLGCGQVPVDDIAYLPALPSMIAHSPNIQLPVIIAVQVQGVMETGVTLLVFQKP